MIGQLLELLAQPRSAAGLARDLGAPVSAVEGMLRLLEARGYVESLPPEAPVCGSCAAGRECSALGAELPLRWVVTAKGRGYAPEG